MVHGGVPEETIDLNLDDLRSGQRVDGDRRGACNHLVAIRHAVLAEEDSSRPDALAKQLQGTFSESLQPLGSLKVTVANSQPVECYSRELSLSEALVRDKYLSGEAEHHREAFVCALGNVLVARFSTSGRGGLALTARLDCPHPGVTLAWIHRLGMCISARAPTKSCLRPGRIGVAERPIDPGTEAPFRRNINTPAAERHCDYLGFWTKGGVAPDYAAYPRR